MSTLQGNTGRFVKSVSPSLTPLSNSLKTQLNAYTLNNYVTHLIKAEICINTKEYNSKDDYYNCLKHALMYAYKSVRLESEVDNTINPIYKNKVINPAHSLIVNILNCCPPLKEYYYNELFKKWPWQPNFANLAQEFKDEYKSLYKDILVTDNSNPDKFRIPGSEAAIDAIPIIFAMETAPNGLVSNPVNPPLNIVQATVIPSLYNKNIIQKPSRYAARERNAHTKHIIAPNSHSESLNKKRKVESLSV